MTNGQFRPDASVAVVIPAHNPDALLRENVASALAQTVACDVVVVDDGSDSRAFPTLPDSVRVIRQRNCGGAVARNHGVLETSAPLVAFLDADDRRSPDKPAQQLDAVAARPDAVAFHTGFSVIGPDGSRIAAGWGRECSGYADCSRATRWRCHRSSFAAQPSPRSGVSSPSTASSPIGICGFGCPWSGPFAFVPETLVEYRVAPHGIGQMSGDPWAAFLEAESVLDRHRLQATRAADPAALETIARGRRIGRRQRARQAATRFVDSFGFDRPTEWHMLHVAWTIDAPTAACAALRRTLSWFRHAMRRPAESTAEVSRVAN
jgi:glycosyltransferase involved in cell wall biosynthesis